MYYVALLFLILLGGTALVIVAQNFTTFLTSEHLILITVSLPGVPILLICLCWAFLGGLLLYVFAAFAARRDTREIKTLRARIQELEKAQAQATSGPLSASIPPPAAPVPGFSSAGPQRQMPTNPPNFSSTGPLQQGQAAKGSAPSSSQITMPLSSRQSPPLPPQGGMLPPFQRQ